MKKVMVFGTFDIFHAGHKNFLRQARKYGTYLIVVVARDKTVAQVKGHQSMNDEKLRARTIRESLLTDMVILGSLKDKYAVIKKYKPDIICLGYDQNFFIAGLESFLEKAGMSGLKIKRLKAYHPQTYKSSILKLKNIC